MNSTRVMGTLTLLLSITSFCNAFGGTLGIVGKDERVQVKAPGVAPFTSIGEIVITNSVGLLNCTATLIDRRHILTAAHCLWNDRGGAFYDGLHEFHLGRVGLHRPSNEDYTYTAFRIPEEYPRLCHVDAGFNYDFGVATLDRDADLDPMPLERAPDTDEIFRIFAAGYPGDKPYGTLWVGSAPDRITRIEQNWMSFTADTFSGESGGPIYSLRDGHAIQFGIIVAEDSSKTKNYAVVINDYVLGKIAEWLKN